jgi:hypothetical protein
MVPLVEQELLTLPDHLSSSRVFSGVRIIRSLVVCLCFVDRYLSFCFFPLAIVLSVLRYTDPEYPFFIFKLCLRRKFILLEIDTCLACVFVLYYNLAF